ncbi:regulatory protein alcr [Fusarium flagelliforme]|uniref:Regulatory protein alcr n=1 Tax=Fusarium flagelliforme TaxID=2675880 RepID=A0A395MAY1_9HYPO|nr:regulatory protein alcr [Fusarium flagelliforme]
MRRQNRSCDQCRKAKRACDAPSLWDIQRNPERVRNGADSASGASLAEEHLDEIDSRALRCSYCLRTRKQCTFNWVRAQLQTGPAAANSNSNSNTNVNPDTASHNGANPRRVPDQSRTKAKRQRPRPQQQPGPAPAQAPLPTQSLDVNATALLDMLQAPPTTHDLSCWGPMDTTGFANFPAFPHTSFDAMPANGVFDPTAFDASLHNSVFQSFEPQPTPGHPHHIDLTPPTELTSQALHSRHQTTEEENAENGWPLFQTQSVGSDIPFQPSPSGSNSYESDISSRAASKALHLAIMAFATQWAQGSQRERDRFPQSLNQMDSMRSEFDDINEDFDRTLQKTFWAQAKRALQDCSDMECFRVVCADLIMGLAQKPRDDEDNNDGPYSMSNFDGESPIASGEGSIASQLSEIIAAEGPPVFMERAARKMHALKFQYEARETGVLDVSGSSLGLEKATAADALSEEDKGTIGLVYWMTVMFDTVSSSMNGRPVVVSDEECHHDPTYPDHPEHESYNIEYRPQDARWWAELFVRENKEGVLRWPCSYDAASKGVVTAAPIKVILFRHVSYLQNTIRSRYRGEPVEKVISNAMAVYKHWNVSYGAFFRDLVEQYDSVPTLIQSWFVCVVAHFHCAALLLADLIELVDENKLGLEYSTQVRQAANVVVSLRRDSANILSDLARVSTRPRAGDVPGTGVSDLHFAVVEGSILTEPWTMILIRAFTKAAILLLTEAEEKVRHEHTPLETPSVMHLVRRCEDCTKALWCLGKKSDMARNIASILSSALGPYMIPTTLSHMPMSSIEPVMV